MKVYTYLEISLEDGRVIREESYEYSGPVAECKGDVKYPQKTDEEVALLRTQNELLQSQLQEQRDFTPYLMQSLGMKKDDAGKWIEMTQTEKIEAMDPYEKSLYESQMAGRGLDIYGNKMTEEQLLERMTPQEKLTYETTKLSGERQLKALKGELPISPQLEENLKSQESQVSEALARKLGPNWQLSTPGIQAMSELKSKSELIREEARRGEINTGTARVAQDQSNLMAKFADIANQLGTSKQMNLSNLATVPSRYTSTGTQAGGLLAAYERQREGETAARMQTEANKAAQSQGLIAGGSAAAAAAAASY